MRSIISMVSISLEGFLSFILLLVVIIVAVVIVAVILVVVVIDAIVRVVIVVASIGVVVVVMIIRIVVIVDGGVSHIIKLSFMIIEISLGPVFLLRLSAFAMAAACASRAAATPSNLGGWNTSIYKTCGLWAYDTSAAPLRSFTDEDGDTGMDDSIGVSTSLGGEISSGEKKFQESDIGDCDNTGDRSKTAGRAIITWGGEIALYACMAFIYGSSCKGEKISMSKRYLVKLFEETGEMLPGKAGK
nr:hypothetical protein [Tanacetum cinerariifolium]